MKNYAPAHSSQSGGRPALSDPYFYAPASHQDDGSMDKPNSLKLYYIILYYIILYYIISADPTSVGVLEQLRYPVTGLPVPGGMGSKGKGECAGPHF